MKKTIISSAMVFFILSLTVVGERKRGRFMPSAIKNLFAKSNSPPDNLA